MRPAPWPTAYAEFDRTADRVVVDLLAKAASARADDHIPPKLAR